MVQKNTTSTGEEILQSKVAMAILRTLIQRDMPLPISRIAKETGSNYVTIRKHINHLENAELITSVEYGKRTLYKTNNTNERILVLKHFIEAWNKAKKQKD